MGTHLIFYPEKTPEWLIGSLNFQMASYIEKDTDFWASKAINAYNAKDVNKSYTMLKIADKLGYHDPYVQTESHPLLSQLEKRFNEEIKDTLKSRSGASIEDIDIIFGNKGPGILIRFIIEDENKTLQKEQCLDALKAIERSASFAGIFAGLRCSYRYPYEKELQEGRLGSLWVESSSFLRTSL